MGSKRTFEGKGLQSDDSTVCFSTSSDTETASELDDTEISEIISVFGKKKKIPCPKKRKFSESQDMKLKF